VLFLLFACLMYFLPTIIGRDKSDAGLIFVVNLLFGWTVVGWIVAFIWACAADARPVPVRLVPVGSSGRFCCQCGTLTVGGAHFCSACGRAF
jgi:Superinfection immunity protein